MPFRPGRVLTVSRQQAAAGWRFDTFIADLARSIPLGRLGMPDDIAAMMALLVSPRGSFVTGTTIQVDGGSYSSLL